MPAPMPEHKFQRKIREHGCQFSALGAGGSHFRITRNGVFVSDYAVLHGGKREVLPIYVSRFEGKISEIEAEEAKAEAEAESAEKENEE